MQCLAGFFMLTKAMGQQRIVKEVLNNALDKLRPNGRQSAMPWRIGLV
jgi:hypothetical protein